MAGLSRHMQNNPEPDNGSSGRNINEWNTFIKPEKEKKMLNNIPLSLNSTYLLLLLIEVLALGPPRIGRRKDI
jgi:hypothetical protein